MDTDYQYALRLHDEEVQKNIKHSAGKVSSSLLGKRPVTSECDDVKYARKLQEFDFRHQKRLDNPETKRLEHNETISRCSSHGSTYFVNHTSSNRNNNDASYLSRKIKALQKQEQQEKDLVSDQRLTYEITKIKMAQRNGSPQRNLADGQFFNGEDRPKDAQIQKPQRLIDRISEHKTKTSPNLMPECKMDVNDPNAQCLHYEKKQKNIHYSAENVVSSLLGKRPETSESNDAKYARRLQKLEFRHQKRLDKLVAERLAHNETISRRSSHGSADFVSQTSSNRNNDDASLQPHNSEEDYLVALQIQDLVNLEQQEEDLMFAQSLADKQTNNEMVHQHRNHITRPFFHPEDRRHNHQVQYMHRFQNRHSRHESNGSNRLTSANGILFEGFNPFTQAAGDNYGIRQESSERLPGMIVPEGIDLNDYESLWNLAEQLGEVRNPGASNQEIGQLPVHQYNKTSQMSLESGECRICITDFVEGETLRSLPCLHVYHKECIDKWLQKNAICPVCRKSVKQE